MRAIVFEPRDRVAEGIDVLAVRARLRIECERVLETALIGELARLQVQEVMRVRDVAAVLVHRRMPHRVAHHADTARKSKSTCEKCCEVSCSESSARRRIADARAPAAKRLRDLRAARDRCRACAYFSRDQLRDRLVQRLLRPRAERLGDLDEQGVDGAPLEGQGARISLIVHQKVDGGVPHRRRAVARSIGDGAVADLEQPLELLAQRRRGGAQAGGAITSERNSSRSRRRPIIMSRQPSSCVMSSSANPASAASDSSRLSSVSRASRARSRRAEVARAKP